MVVELIAEHEHDFAPRALGDVPRAGCGVNGALCAVECCIPALRPSRPE
jgi:ferrochelatase